MNGSVQQSWDKWIALVAGNPYGDLELGAVREFVEQARDLPHSTPVKFTGARNLNGDPFNPPSIPGAILELSLGSTPPPGLTYYGEPAEHILSEFNGVRCVVCNHDVLFHRDRFGCTEKKCPCKRRPVDFT